VAIDPQLRSDCPYAHNSSELQFLLQCWGQINGVLAGQGPNSTLGFVLLSAVYSEVVQPCASLGPCPTSSRSRAYLTPKSSPALTRAAQCVGAGMYNYSSPMQLCPKLSLNPSALVREGSQVRDWFTGAIGSLVQFIDFWV
jgi:hypothetical protein